MKTTSSTSAPKQHQRIGLFDVLQFWPLVPVLPLAAAATHLFARPRSWSPARKALLAVAGTAAAITVVRWQLQRFTVAQPRYKVLEHDGNFELRRYPDLVVAQTRVEADFEVALNEGFSRLAGFIFGKNTRRERVGMTSPVVSQPEKLAMTSPVTTQQERGEGYTVSFMMPPERTVDDLPLPDDDRVVVRVQPARTVATLRFRGRYDGKHVERAESQLMNGVSSRGLELRGQPAFAGYDGPSTLPFLRRNEVWVEVASSP
jgi:hypothetical protein